MPKTLIAKNKLFVDGTIIPAGQKFTTSAFDKMDLPDDVMLEGDEPAPMPEAESTDYAAKTLVELRKIAKELRVDAYSTMAKDHLIIAIESMEQANAMIADSSTYNGAGLAVPVNSAADVAAK